MSRKLLILLLTVLVAVVAGCGGAHRYDSRLTQVDSLMKAAPDSALTLVVAINADSLMTDRDRAYRDLLLTQARYKCYITATSDSDINRALDYYRNHPADREKLTRTYIYKGAVMEELGHPDSAMYYYKNAEAAAEPTDYFNLGYINLRIAELYQSHNVNDSAVVFRMQQADKFFQIARDTNYLITTSGAIGAYDNVIGNDSSRLYLYRAIRLAEAIHSPKGFQYQSKLAGSYFYDADYHRAKELAMDIVNRGRDYCNEWQFYHYAARSYIYLNQIDSARWLISQIPAPISASDSMNHYITLAELARATRNYDDYVRYQKEANRIDTRIMDNALTNQLPATELKWDADQIEHNLNMRSIKRISIILIITILAIAALIVAFVLMMRYRTARFHKEIESAKLELDKLLNNLDEERLSFEMQRQELVSQIEEKESQRQDLISQIKRRDIELAEITKHNDQLTYRRQRNKPKVSDIVRHRQAAINELYASIRIRSDLDKDRKRPLLLMSTLRDLYENQGILYQPLSKSFWDNLRYSVEWEFQGIVSFVEQHYPNLTGDDIKLFMLCCADFPNKIIKICMGYTSDVTTSKNKKKLFAVKLGTDVKANGFIQLYLKGKLPLE